MISSGTRWLINAASFVLLCWIGYVVYGSFTDSGMWRVVARWFSTDYSAAWPAGVFACCVLIGCVPIGALAWVIWRVALRGRVAADFPSASVRR